MNNGQAFRCATRLPARENGKNRPFFLRFSRFFRFLAGFAALAFFAAAVSSARAVAFDPARDGFAFANDTVRVYLPDASGRIVSHRRKDGEKPRFAHSCFLLSRAVMQFAQFARFAPGEPKLSEAEYERRLVRLFRIPVWASRKREKIVFPGYKNLYEFSAANVPLLEKNLGSWLLSYFRLGNWRMCLPFPRDGQALAAGRLVAGLSRGHLEAVYLARFPHMNHCVVLYHYTLEPGGDVKFSLYDPNYPGKPAWLRYHAGTRSFELEKRWYFNTGRVNLMRVYLSPVH